MNQFATANANPDARCAPPLIMEYYNCNGKGALETVMTRDSFFEQEQEKEETTSIAVEARDPPEPQTEIANETNANIIANKNASNANNPNNPNRPRSSLGVHKKKETFFDTLCLPKGLLQKARGGRASPVAVHTLETGKLQQSLPNKNTKNNNNTAKNQKPSNGRCVVNIPMYAKEAVGRQAALDSNKIKTNLAIDTSHNDEPKNGEVEEDAAVLATAAAKWRMAKEKYLVRESRSAESESRDRYSVHDDITSRDSNSNSDSTSTASSDATSDASSGNDDMDRDCEKTKSNNADSDASEVEKPGSLPALDTSFASISVDDNGESRNVRIETNASNHNTSSTTSSVEEPRDPPGTLSGAPSVEEEDGDKEIVIAIEENEEEPLVVAAAGDSQAHLVSTLTNETESQPPTEEGDQKEPPTDENDDDKEEESPQVAVAVSILNRDYMSQFSKSLQEHQDHQAAHLSMLMEQRRELERRKTNRKQPTTIASSSSILSDDASR